MIAYKVKVLGRKKPDMVYADYFRTEDNVITFRIVNRDQGYPIFVKCYAAGTWLSVENAVKQHRKELHHEAQAST